MMIELIKQKSLEYFDEVLRLRRHLHQHPELSFEEFKTQALVKEQLSAKGIEVTSIANTGLVALIKGEKSVSEKLLQFLFLLCGFVSNSCQGHLHLVKAFSYFSSFK